MSQVVRLQAHQYTQFHRVNLCPCRPSSRYRGWRNMNLQDERHEWCVPDNVPSDVALGDSGSLHSEEQNKVRHESSWEKDSLCLDQGMTRCVQSSSDQIIIPARMNLPSLRVGRWQLRSSPACAQASMPGCIDALYSADPGRSGF